MLIFLYRLLYLPGLLIGLPYYAYRMWRRGGYRTGFSNRFGLLSNLPPKCNDVKRIWIQAVSVGELLAIRPMLRELKNDPNIEVFLTTTTSTGLRVLKNDLSELVAWYGVFPLDFWPFSRKTWTRINPDLAILMEGELWPEHIHQAHLRKVPVILANARLSDRSYNRHYKFRNFAWHYLKKLSFILTSSTSDQQRFEELNWIPKDRIHLTGNLKLDVARTEPPSETAKSEMLKEFGMPEDTLLFLGSATWADEECLLVDAYNSLKGDYPNLRMLIVPRHAERKPQLESMVQTKDVSFHFRSESRQAPGDTEIYFGDTTGELATLTNFADLVFVGKSIPPNRGGQTPVEAAAMGKPLISGPEMSNFRNISRNLQEAGAAVVIQSADELVPVVKSLLDDPQRRQSMGDAASAIIEASRGATERVVAKIKDVLEK